MKQFCLVFFIFYHNFLNCKILHPPSPITPPYFKGADSLLSIASVRWIVLLWFRVVLLDCLPNKTKMRNLSRCLVSWERWDELISFPKSWNLKLARWSITDILRAHVFRHSKLTSDFWLLISVVWVSADRERYDGKQQ